MEKKVLIQQYKQNNQDFINFIIDFESLNRICKVLVYGEDKFGYQRKPVKLHYLKIKNYLISDTKAILPSSIILGVDEDEISKYLKKENEYTYLNISIIKDKIFRIVDGQHRLKGLEDAVKENPSLKYFNLNVVTIITKKDERSKELVIFTDINSKSKRIRVDLALLAKHNYEIYEQKIENLSEHIAIKVAYKLKEDEKKLLLALKEDCNINNENVWKNGIKFDIHEENALGIVSVNAFKESIQLICDLYIKENNANYKDLTSDEQIIISEKLSDETAKIILKAWMIISNKWHGCFKKTIEKDNFNEIQEYFYNNEYYIQRTLGVKALNGILYDLIKEQGVGALNMDDFKKIITNSKVKIENWRTGDIFSGLSSESGFKKAKEIILGNIDQYYETV